MQFCLDVTSCDLGGLGRIAVKCHRDGHPISSPQMTGSKLLEYWSEGTATDCRQATLLLHANV